MRSPPPPGGRSGAGPAAQAELEASVRTLASAGLNEAYSLVVKQERRDRIAAIRDSGLAERAAGAAPRFGADAGKKALGDLEYRIVRDGILSGAPRIDGRDHKTVRAITVKVGVLPRTHGSALSPRGEPQALVGTTPGTGPDAQVIAALEGERKEPFMLHYNFPPFSVGETGMMTGPKRREIGHGNLARRGIFAVMPDMTTFPYVIRVVSEILESN